MRKLFLEINSYKRFYKYNKDVSAEVNTVLFVLKENQKIKLPLIRLVQKLITGIVMGYMLGYILLKIYLMFF